MDQPDGICGQELRAKPSGNKQERSMDRTMIIIGSGAAGLTAGCYARMNGYKTTILEMEDTPGGLCTSWRRKGYLFDGSVAGLAGSAPGSSLYQLWEEIGVASYCPLHYGENFGHIRLLDGRTITVYANVDRLEAHFREHFPSEGAVIREFIRAIRAVLDLDIPFSDAQGWKAVQAGLRTFLSSITHLPVLLKYGTLTIRQFNQKIKDPALVTVFQNLVHFGGLDVPLLTVLLPLAYAHRKMAGIPLRGWLSFARAIERRYLELGGMIQYRARVERLVIENGGVKGVVLADGTALFASRVVSAADGRFTQSLLPGVRESDLARSFHPADLSDQPVEVNLGVAEDFSSEDGAMTYILSQPFTAAGRAHTRITVHNKYYDPEAAPSGKSALTIFLDSDYDWWKQIAADASDMKRRNSTARTALSR